MFLRCTRRNKIPVLERRRQSRSVNQRVVQRRVLYLGEINGTQKAAWYRSIEVLQSDSQHGRQVALFLEDRATPELAQDVVHVRVQIRRPRQWGGCWLACELWRQLLLDEFWQSRQPTPNLPLDRKKDSQELRDADTEPRCRDNWCRFSACQIAQMFYVKVK